MTWQKWRKYRSQVLLNFKNWCYTRSLHTENEKSKLISRLSNFTNPFIPPCDDQVSDADDLFWFHQHAPCYCGKIFCKTAWQIQMPYMDTIRAVHYNLSVPYLCPQYVSFTLSHVSSNFCCCSSLSFIHSTLAAFNFKMKAKILLFKNTIRFLVFAEQNFYGFP